MTYYLYDLLRDEDVVVDGGEEERALEAPGWKGTGAKESEGQLILTEDRVI